MQGIYYEAEVKDVDVDRRSLELMFPAHAGLAAHTFSLSYDLLILAVGSCANTFGIQAWAKPPFQIQASQSPFPMEVAARPTHKDFRQRTNNPLEL
jgi:NADH dehydrogenase FAD-containing subunit